MPRAKNAYVVPKYDLKDMELLEIFEMKQKNEKLRKAKREGKINGLNETQLPLTNKQLCLFIKEKYKLKFTPSISWLKRLNIDKVQCYDKRHGSKPHFPELDLALVEWINDVLEKNLVLTDNIIIEQAKRYYDILKKYVKYDKELEFSKGWLRNFKMNHNIKQRIMNGESNLVKREVVQKQIDTIQMIIDFFLKVHGASSIWNCDESGLYWKAMGLKSLTMNGKKISISNPKDRITILFTVSLNGLKRRPLIIGKSELKNKITKQKQLEWNIQYKHQENSWMNSDIFWNYLQEWDTELKKEHENKLKIDPNAQTKILLLMDNCKCHSIFKKDPHDKEKYHYLNLDHILVIFLPENTTSILQPLDQGIIQSFKKKFRSIQCSTVVNRFNSQESEIMKTNERILRIVRSNNQSQISPQIQVQQQVISQQQTDRKVKHVEESMKFQLVEVMPLIKEAWDSVSKDCIINCWYHTELVKYEQAIVNPNIILLQNENPQTTNSLNQINIENRTSTINWKELETVKVIELKRKNEMKTVEELQMSTLNSPTVEMEIEETEADISLNENAERNKLYLEQSLNASVEINNESIQDEDFDITMPDSLDELEKQNSIQFNSQDEEENDNNENFYMIEEELREGIVLSESPYQKRIQLANLVNRLMNYYDSLEGERLYIDC